MLSDAFVEVLRSGRAELNARFSEARRQHRDLDADVFRRYLESTVNPWVEATHTVASDRVAAVVMAAYEVGLELVGLRLVGPGERQQLLAEGLRRLLPAAAETAAADPHLAITSLGNALHQLLAMPGARAEEWIDRLQALAPRVDDLPTLLRLGQVLAWQSGLAHYRTSALEIAHELPKDLALEAFGASTDAEWRTVAESFEDRWSRPQRLGLPYVAHELGAFRGFGGDFLEPPKLSVCGDSWLVRSGGDAWLLIADAYGATLHRAMREEIAAAERPAHRPAGLVVEERRLRWQGKDIELPLAGPPATVAVIAGAVGITSTLSHRIAIVVLGS